MGELADAHVAQRTGWRIDAARQKRKSLDMPNPPARGGAYNNARWTEAEQDLVRRPPPREAAEQTDRTVDAVYQRRRALGLPPARRRPASKR
jgi:hypothetical protein